MPQNPSIAPSKKTPMIHIIDTWQNLTFSEQIFSTIGLVSNLLFVIYYLFSHFLDSDSTDSADLSPDGLLPMLSLRGILAFGMFTGWTAFALARSGYSTLWASLGGIAAGWFAAWLVWRMLRWMLTWQSSGTLDMRRAIGKNGVVHLVVPAIGQGTGKIHLELQGALRELDAIAATQPLLTGTRVIVVDYDLEQGIAIVEQERAIGA